MHGVGLLQSPGPARGLVAGKERAEAGVRPGGGQLRVEGAGSGPDCLGLIQTPCSPAIRQLGGEMK